MPRDDGLQVAKDLLSFTFLRLLPQIGRPISKQGLQFTPRVEQSQTHQDLRHLHFGANNMR